MLYCTMRNNAVCIVIPAYNAGKTIGELLEALRQELPHVSIVVIDDGSSDQTSRIVAELACENLSCHRHSPNQGKGYALRKGFWAASSIGADIVVTMDADGQHRPRDVHVLLQALLDDEADFVIGTRMNHVASMPLHRICSNTITSTLISLRIGRRIPDSQCGFRAFRLEIVDKMELCKDHFDMETEMLLKLRPAMQRICSVPVETVYHAHVTSAIRFIDIFRFISVYFTSY